MSFNQELKPEGDIKVVDFSGGLYAVTQIEVNRGEEGTIIPASWEILNLWCGNSEYTIGHQQWLEEHSQGGIPIALYLPIKE